MVQIIVLGTTFWVLAVINAMGYTWLASKLSESLQTPLVNMRLNRVGGILLLGAGGISLMWEA